jgi:serine/threonine protein kinase, bacterial
MPLAPGDVFAGYTVVRALGSGGMGEVYLVDHPRLPRRDALKVLPLELTTDREYRERFNREADIVANLWHPHIAPPAGLEPATDRLEGGCSIR